MTEKWTNQQLEECVAEIQSLTEQQKNELTTVLNQEFSYKKYQLQNELRLKALANQIESKRVLSGAKQLYPATMQAELLSTSAAELAGYAIVLTAGGEGERLRLSLADLGYTEAQLHNFTKATFPLPGLPADFGALQANLCLIAKLCRDNLISIPVVITTGPAGSTTAEYIPQILKKYNNFGVKELRVICQAERLHLNNDGKIVVDLNQLPPFPLTNPDETGGPLMQLREITGDGDSCLEWFTQKSCAKILVLQATALYNPAMLLAMAAAGRNYDGLGVGIVRNQFPLTDPYGTFVQIKKADSEQLIIVEKDIRNETTYQLKDQSGDHYLPFNTGFYVFDCNLLKNGQLPDYATPPKEQLPNQPKSPKIGYAATDILSLAKNPAVLTLPPDWFAVIKSADDLNLLSDLALKCGLDKIIDEMLYK